MVEGTDYASSSVGNIISGPLFLKVGYYGVFGAGTLCNLVALIYIVGFLKESREGFRRNNVARDGTIAEHCDNKTSNNVVSKSLLYILEGLKTVVKPREGLRRSLIMLGVLSYTLYICIYTGTEEATRIYFGKSLSVIYCVQFM